MNRFLLTTIVVSIAIHLATAYFILSHWQFIPVTPQKSETELVVIKPPPPPPKLEQPDESPEQQPQRVNPKPAPPPPTGADAPKLPVPSQDQPAKSTEGAGKMISPDPEPDRPTVRAPLKYPAAAQEEGVEGAVILVVTVDGSGEVLSVVVEKAEPPGWFESAAVSSVRRWKFKGSGQPRVVRVVVAFELSEPR
jgi:protein TonB